MIKLGISSKNHSAPLFVCSSTKHSFSSRSLCDSFIFRMMMMYNSELWWCKQNFECRSHTQTRPEICVVFAYILHIRNSHATVSFLMKKSWSSMRFKFIFGAVVLCLSRFDSTTCSKFYYELSFYSVCCFRCLFSITVGSHGFIKILPSSN